jgi:hypothetical protein
MKRVSSGIMRRFTSALTATVVLMNLANAAGDLVWFNGSFDNENGLASERNTLVSDARTYDNFSLPSGYNQVTGLLGQFYLTLCFGKCSSLLGDSAGCCSWHGRHADCVGHAGWRDLYRHWERLRVHYLRNPHEAE